VVIVALRKYHHGWEVLSFFLCVPTSESFECRVEFGSPIIYTYACKDDRSTMNLAKSRV
jgi:hypothetical protein